MRRLTLALFLSLALSLPALAPAKGMNGPVSVSWNGAPPADTTAGGTWHAAFTLFTGPGGYYPEQSVHPVLLITDAAGKTRHVRALPDGDSGNAFRADVPFPRAGAYDVGVRGFDLREPYRVSAWGPVRIGPAVGAPSREDGNPSRWPWVLGGLVAAAALLAGGRLRPRTRRAARA